MHRPRYHGGRELLHAVRIVLFDRLGEQQSGFRKRGLTGVHAFFVEIRLEAGRSSLRAIESEPRLAYGLCCSLAPMFEVNTDLFQAGPLGDELGVPIAGRLLDRAPGRDAGGRPRMRASLEKQR